VALAVLASFGPALSRRAAATFCDLACNVPPVVQAFFAYFAVGADSFLASLIGISVYAAGQIGETVRAGILTLPKTQIESAVSSGMRSRHYIAYIVLPQALEEMLQPLAGRFVNILKNTSLGMTVGYAELTLQSRQIETLTFRGVEAITASMAIYSILGGLTLLGFSLLAKRVHARRGKVIS
jgi:ABC-type amino acid transport system permease subunit